MSFKPYRCVRFKVTCQRQAISAPFVPPVRLTLTHDGGVVRTGTSASCRATAGGLHCRQP